MKVKTFAFIALCALGATRLWADASNLMISFSTVGPDKYANGSVVKDGEWYVLTWSKGVFAGFNADLTPVNPEDKVLLAAPLAEGGRCSHTFFQLNPTLIQNGGHYQVYLLDTRDGKGNPCKPGTDGLPKIVNGSNAAGGEVAKDVSGFGSTTAGWDETAVQATELKIVDFVSLAEDNVQLTVSGMLPSVRYNVKWGKDLNAVSAYVFPPNNLPTGENANIIVKKPNTDKAFFTITRQPIDAPDATEEKAE